METPPTAAPNVPVALTVAGSDSGGGAGVQADLRAFRDFGVHGCSALTALTAQNPFRVGAILPATPDFLRAQIDCVAEAFDVRAAKTGMLHDAALAAVVAEAMPRLPRAKWVVDPVMVATSGARLLDDAAVGTLVGRVFPHAALITPNLPETEALLRFLGHGPGRPPREAARALAEALGVPVLVKGGHGADAAVSEDWLARPGEAPLCLRAPRLPHPLTTHGTGCALSAAIAANLALGRDLPDALVAARVYLLNLLAAARPAGRAAVYAAPEARFSAADVAVARG